MAPSTLQPNETLPTTPSQKFPLLDSDPHFSRVVSYFRPVDYVTVASATAGVPALLYAWNLAEPLKVTSVKTNPRFYGIGAWLGFVGGFLYSYQQSTFRFYGWRENDREQKLQDKDFKMLAKSGQSIWGESDQPEWIQRAAYRNSQFSQLKISAIPWFNVVNHPYHGVDVSKYYEEAES